MVVPERLGHRSKGEVWKRRRPYTLGLWTNLNTHPMRSSSIPHQRNRNGLLQRYRSWMSQVPHTFEDDAEEITY